MLTRRELALVLALLLAVAVAAAVPGVRTPFSRLANYESDGPDPLYDARLDARAIRRAGELLPERTTYAVYAPGAGPLLAGNLKGAGQLFLAPALPVQDPTDAGWILSYRAGRLLPRGLEPARVHRLGEGIFLVRVER